MLNNPDMNKLQIRGKYFNCTQLIFLFLFLLIAFLTLNSFFKIGVTLADDLENYLTGLEGNFFADAQWYAKYSGRFYFLITKPLYHLPYIFDNFLYTKILQYGFLLLSFILFMQVINKIFKQKDFALLIFLLLFSFLSVTKPLYFMPIIAYPFFFTFSFSIFLLALLFLLKYIEIGKYKYLILSAILSAITLLFYETYLLFIVFIGVFLFIRRLLLQGNKIFADKSFYKEILPFIFAVIAYIITYFAYRYSIESDYIYSGSSFAKKLNIINVFKAMWNYTKSALPMFTYYDSLGVIKANSLFPMGHQNNFFYILIHSESTSIVNVIIQCFIFCILCLKMEYKITWKKLGLGLLFSFLFTFLVHLLLAVSEKYNTAGFWNELSGYVTSFYSYFCFVLFYGLIIYICVKTCCRRKWLKNTAIGFFTLLLFYAGIIINYSNEHLGRDYQRSQNRFRLMEKVLEKGLFDNVSDNAVIYAGELNNTSSLHGYITGQTFRWEKYVFLKTGKQRNIYDFFNDFQNIIQENPQREIYYITKYEMSKNQDMFLALSKINNESVNINEGENLFCNTTSNESVIYYYSSYKEFIFEFYIPQCTETTVVLVNDTEYKAIQGLNAIKICAENKKEEIISFELKSSVPFSTKKFAISNIGFVNEETMPIYDF